MIRSFHVLAALAACALSASGIAAPKPCSYTDLMPAYQVFANRTAQLPPEQRAADFLANVAARYPDYYSPEVFGDDQKLRARAVRFFDPAQRSAVFPGNAPLTDARLAAMGTVIGPQFLAQQQRFIHVFADFSCSSTVEFGVSLLKFDGHPTDFGGKRHLLFGVDVITILHDESQMPSFFAHEIFHIYHEQVIADQIPQGDSPGWYTMWLEGLATYVSQRMNPKLDAQHVLWSPSDIVSRMQADTPRAAKLLLADLDRTGMRSERWFLMGTEVEGLPARAGYYLGYLFAKSVGDAVPLPQLARMPLEQVHKQEVAFLTRLAQP
jgi:hypothetical protein